MALSTGAGGHPSGAAGHSLAGSDQSRRDKRAAPVVALRRPIQDLGGRTGLLADVLDRLGADQCCLCVGAVGNRRRATMALGGAAGCGDLGVGRISVVGAHADRLSHAGTSLPGADDPAPGVVGLVSSRTVCAAHLRGYAKPLCIFDQVAGSLHHGRAACHRWRRFHGDYSRVVRGAGDHLAGYRYAVVRGRRAWADSDPGGHGHLRSDDCAGCAVLRCGCCCH